MSASFLKIRGCQPINFKQLYRVAHLVKDTPPNKVLKCALQPCASQTKDRRLSLAESQFTLVSQWPSDFRQMR